MRHRVAVFMLTLGAVLVAGSAPAIPLSDLLQGAALTAGDRRYDQWTLIGYEASDASRALNAENIDVQALMEADWPLGPPGLSFVAPWSVSGGGELYVSGDDGYGFVDLTFGFRASVLDPASWVSLSTLNYRGSFFSYDPAETDTLAGSRIRATIGPAGAEGTLGTAEVEHSTRSAGHSVEGTAVLTASVGFAPQTEVWVTENIRVWANGSDEIAGIGWFDQRFSQAAVPVPEPGTAALLVSGLVGAALVRRGRRR